MSSYSYSPNYFSIEDILATQERCTCKFLVNVPKLGKLNSATEDVDLKVGTSLELPLWLAEQLSSGLQPVVSVDLPRIYKESFREILKADACTVNLHKFGLYFYELGWYVKQFDGRGDVSKILLHTFQTRFRQLMDLTHNTESDPTVQDRLDIIERMLFKEGHLATMKLHAWLTHSGAPLTPATMVLNHKKRKRIELDNVMF